MQEEYKPNEVNKERAEKVEGVDTSSEVISAELEINDVLAPYFKNAETGKYAKSDRAYIKIKLDSVEEFDELDTLFGIIGIDPWSDKEHLLYTIDNHYDIENLVERGIVDGLLPEAIDVEEEIEMYSRASSLPQLRPIPELFKGTRENTFEKYEKLLENEQNKEESLQEGSTNDSVTFLYSRYKKKYRRESGGAVYRKSTQGEEIEITREEENLLIEKARAGDPKAREEVLTMNMGLVYFVALNIGRRFPMINLADLVQESLIAMNHCIASHDPTLAKFSSYALVSMEGKALRFVGDNIEQVRTPLHRREEFHEMEKHPEALKGKTHKEQISHVSTLLSVTEKTAEALLEAKELVWKASYIDIDDVTDAEEGTFLSSTADDPSLLHDQIELKKVTATMLDMLTPREAKILRMHYGIDMVDEKESTLDEIGEEIGVTRERVRQIEIRAVRKLRHPSRHEKLVPWTNPKQQK